MTVTGNPAEFTVNGVAATVNSLTVPFHPVQDLNGYANPWPGGGGINMFDMDSAVPGYITGAGTSINSPDAQNMTSDFIPVTAGETYTYTAWPSEVGTEYWTGWCFYGSQSMSDNIDMRSTTFGTTVTITVPTGAAYIRIGSRYLASGKAQFEKGSVAHDWQPYSNICPISGRTGLSVYRTGKNLLDVAERVQNQTNTAGTPSSGYTLTNGVLSISKDLYNYGRVMLSAMRMKAGTYTLSFAVSISGSGRISYSIRDMGANPKVDVVGTTETTLASVTKTFTLANDSDIAISIQPERSGTGIISISNIQLELGSTATTYESYRCNTYAVDWTTEAGTVYHGTVDPVTGQLTADRASVLFDGTQDVGLANWEPNSSSVGWLYRPGVTPGILNQEIFEDTIESSGFISDTLKTVKYASGAGVYGETSPCISLVGTTYWGVAMRLNDTTLTTAAKINEYLSANPIRVVYKLATPLTYQLTPQTINLLAGIRNYVWSDTNEDITISFDVAAFIRHLFRVNGVDFSRFVERDSYATALEPVYAETIQTMDGVNHTALLRTRGSIRLRFNPQTDSDTAALCSALLAAPCEVQYRCLQRDVDVTALMCVDTISAQFLSRCLYLGDEWNQMESITLTEL